MSKEPGAAPSLAILFAVVFIDLVGFGIIIPLLPFYGEHFGAAPDVVAFLMATYSLTQFIAAPLWGKLSDRVGRRPVLLLSLAGTVVGYLGLAYADSLGALFAARAFGGAMAGSISAAFAYAADVTPSRDRARGMGLVGAAFGLGFIAGPAIGGILAGHDPAAVKFHVPALTAAGFSFAALVAALVLLKESLPPEKRAEQVVRSLAEKWRALAASLGHGQIRLIIGLNFFAVLVIGGLEATFAMWSERAYGWGVAQNGYMFAYMGLVLALTQGGLAGPLARRLGEAWMVRLGFLLLGLGLVAIPLASSVAWLVAAVSIVAFGFSMATPGLNSLLSRAADAREQGLILGIGRSGSILARVVGPAGAGLLFAGLGRDWPFYAGCAVMAGLLVVTLIRLRGPAQTPASS